MQKGRKHGPEEEDTESWRPLPNCLTGPAPTPTGSACRSEFSAHSTMDRYGELDLAFRVWPRRFPGQNYPDRRRGVSYPVESKAVGVAPVAAVPSWPRSDTGPVLAGTGAVRLRLGQHPAIASLVHQVGHRHLAPAVVAGAVGVLHLGAPGHPASDAHGADARVVTTGPRPTGAAHHHAVAPALLPGHHLDLGGHDQFRRRGPEQHPVQLRQHLP